MRPSGTENSYMYDGEQTTLLETDIISVALKASWSSVKTQDIEPIGRQITKSAKVFELDVDDSPVDS